MRNLPFPFLMFLCGISCTREPVKPQVGYTEDYAATALHALGQVDSAAFMANDSTVAIKIVAFARQQLGKPYKYCSMTPDGGFDCSGFINYVFNRFNISVPRSSVEFTNIGVEIQPGRCRAGDLILFTGTNPGIRTVGHIGLIIANDDGGISFIQSTSGADYGVVITRLNESYMERFVKIIRLPLTRDK